MAVSKVEKMADRLKSFGYIELEPRAFYSMLFKDCLPERNTYRSGMKGVGMVQTVIEPKEAGKGGVKTFYKNLDGLKKAIENANAEYESLEKEGRLQDVKILTMTNGCSYLGRSMAAKNIFEMSALIVEVDDLIGNDTTNQEGLCRLLASMERNNSYSDRLGSPMIPKPTVIVCSGSGVHLYYIFEKPIRVNKKYFPKHYRDLNYYKYCLMYTLWNRLDITKKELEVQGIDQRYRVVGTRTKSGDICRAFFSAGSIITADYMNSFSESIMVSEGAGAYRRAEMPRIYEIENTAPGTGGKNQTKGGRKYPRYGTMGRGAYEQALERVYKYAKEGKRYWMVFCLAATARSCAIPEEELKKDADNLLEYLDSLTIVQGNEFTKYDMECALKSYYYDGPFMSKATYEEISGVKCNDSIKRNGRPRKEHLELAREAKRQKREKGEPVDPGRSLKWWPVLCYRFLHEDGTKAGCEKETGLSRHTVLKYWGLWEGLGQSDAVLAKELLEQKEGHTLEDITGNAALKGRVENRLKEGGLLEQYKGKPAAKQADI